ncbi:hypothetical protein WA158_002065 [Blastocystis sp. Blastoise]
MDYRNKRRRYDNKSTPKAVMENGCNGVLVTCDRGKESMACQEVYRLLDEYIEKLYPKAKQVDEKSEEHNEKDLASKLDDELKELGTKSRENHYSRLNLGMQAMAFIKIGNPMFDPVKIVTEIIKTSKAENTSLVRYCARIIPAQNTCYASNEKIIETLKPLIKNVFTESNKGIRWYARISVRNNDQFVKEDLRNELCALLQNDYVSDYLNPQIAICVDVFKAVCSVCIIPEWEIMNDLSLRTLLAPKKEKKSKSEKEDNQFVNKPDQDWRCPQCDSPNYKTLDTCWKCQAPRPQFDANKEFTTRTASETKEKDTNEKNTSCEPEEDNNNDNEIGFKLFG